MNMLHIKQYMGALITPKGSKNIPIRYTMGKSQGMDYIESKISLATPGPAYNF
jgi:hypothetical protein